VNDGSGASRTVLVPGVRVARWFENFGTRHGAYALGVTHGALTAVAEDGARAEATLPWSRRYAGPADPVAFAEAVALELRWGVLLVRRGGFAVAAGTGQTPAYTKVGRRHVQGQTKAGGWSQQRYARRRGNQARAAFEAAADHAHRVLHTEFGGVVALTCGGDRPAVESVLDDPRLSDLRDARTDRWLAVGDPSSEILRKAVADAHAVEIAIDDGQGAGGRIRLNRTNE
jgi:hypothetical protein